MKKSKEDRILSAREKEMDIRKEIARVKEDFQMRKKMLKEIEEREKARYA